MPSKGAEWKKTVFTRANYPILASRVVLKPLEVHCAPKFGEHISKALSFLLDIESKQRFCAKNHSLS